MDETSLISQLAELTGLLSPAEGTPPEALDHARRLLAEALLNGQPVEDPSKNLPHDRKEQRCFLGFAA